MIGEYGYFVWLTYLGVSFSTVSIYFILQGNYNLAMQLYILATLCDLFDGKVARLGKRNAFQEAYGKEIDSLSDVINFACVPMALILTSSVHDILKVVIALLLALSVITRLAYFNCIEKESDQALAYFVGLPSAYAGLFYPLALIITKLFQPSLWSASIAFLSILLSNLFILKIKISKPDTKAYIFYLLLAVICFLILGGM